MNIARPTLVLNKTVSIQNIELMLEKAHRHKVRLRPHFKTHQSIEIGRWFRELGITQITVSSVSMAAYFASDGWDDMTIAFPFNTLEIDALNQLTAERQINIVVDNVATIMKISSRLSHPTGIFVKITTGFNRVGISSSSVQKIEQLVQSIETSPLLKFKGFITHAGHAYEARSRNEVQNIHFDAVQKMSHLKNLFRRKYPNIEISIGDTPGCSVSEYFQNIDEIRPGNFVFYDLKQHSLGACKIDDIAVRMHCPVVSKQRQRNEIVIYGGAVHFSKDWIQNIDGKPLYGRIIVQHNGIRTLLPPTDYLCRLSQEHGIIKISADYFNNIEVGDIIEVIPVHSCLTASAMGRYLSTKNEVLTMMPPF